MSTFAIEGVEATETGWRVLAEVPEGTAYVDGHFPGSPIVPAVAQLALLTEAIGAAWKRSVALAGIGDLRFRSQVVPGDRIEVAFSPAEPPAAPNREGDVRFRITKDGKVVSQGLVQATVGGDA